MRNNLHLCLALPDLNVFNAVCLHAGTAVNVLGVTVQQLTVRAYRYTVKVTR